MMQKKPKIFPSNDPEECMIDSSCWSVPRRPPSISGIFQEVVCLSSPPWINHPRVVSREPQ